MNTCNVYHQLFQSKVVTVNLINPVSYINKCNHLSFQYISVSAHSMEGFCTSTVDLMHENTMKAIGIALSPLRSPFFIF